jgi:hypothetical protein
MIDYRQLPDARPRDTRMLSPPPFCWCERHGGNLDGRKTALFPR